MNKKMFLVQRINSCCCERLNINNLYFGLSKDKAFDIYQKEIEAFIKEKYNDCTNDEKIEKIEHDISETKTYWEYCDDDGENIVIMIEDFEIPVLALSE